jgi:glyoxylate reductase
MRMRARIFITQPIAETALTSLRSLCDVAINPDALHIPTADELIAAVKRCDILYCMLHDRVGAEVIAANPHRIAATRQPMNIRGTPSHR